MNAVRLVISLSRALATLVALILSFLLIMTLMTLRTPPTTAALIMFGRVLSAPRFFTMTVIRVAVILAAPVVAVDPLAAVLVTVRVMVLAAVPAMVRVMALVMVHQAVVVAVLALALVPPLTTASRLRLIPVTRSRAPFWSSNGMPCVPVRN